MIDLHIQRGSSTVLFSEPGVINPRLIIEEGCWYLCTDTAELFLGVQLEDGLTLKRINESADLGESIDPEVLAALRTEINTLKESLKDFAKKSDLPDVSKFITEIPSEYITETELNNKGFLTEHQDLSDYAKKTELPSTEGLATEDFVLTKIAEAELNDKEIDITGLATKDDIKNLASTSYVDGKVAAIEIPSVPTKVGELENDAGYLTEHQDLSAYAKKTELPSTEGLASEDYVDNAIKAIDFPEADFSKYSTTEEMTSAINTAVVVKAENVPFTTAKFVTSPVGSFTSGESIKDLTVAELFAKLLGLSDNPTQAPDNFDQPEESPERPTSVAEQIVANKLMMYSVNMNNELAAADFKVVKMTPSEAASAPSISGFYQIEDNGEIIESGYQDLQILKDDTYYIIALPRVIDYETMIELRAYDSDTRMWNACEKLPFISDSDTVAGLCDEVGVDTSHIDTELYTVLVYEDTCVGSKYRYIIKEVN